MGLDDRERNFEKAMARELRADSLNGLHCPDAETLAAYHDRMLSPEEMSAQKSHIASCARCQEILATLEVTEGVAAETNQPENVVAARAEKALSAVHAGPVFSQPPATARLATPSPNVRAMPKPKPYLRWVVPAGAIAAGVLVWVAMNQSWNAPKAPDSARTEVAENRRQNDPVLVAPKGQAISPSLDSQAAIKRDSDAKTATKQEFDRYEGQSNDALTSGARTRSAPTFPHGPAGLQNQTQNQIQNNNANAGNFDKQKQVGDVAIVGGAMSKVVPANKPRRMEGAMKTAPAAVPPSPSAAPGTGSGSGAGSGPPASAIAADESARKDEITRSTTQSVEVTEAAPSVLAEQKEAANESAAAKKLKAADANGVVIGQSLRDSNFLQVMRIPTPNPKVFWTFTKGSPFVSLEKNGKPSRNERFGEEIKLIAGSAPTAGICWLLSENGTVLRTTDGGKHWSTLNAPGVAKFTEIQATSAMQATIEDAGQTVSYSTVDGGVTWNVVVQP